MTSWTQGRKAAVTEGERQRLRHRPPAEQELSQMLRLSLVIQPRQNAFGLPRCAASGQCPMPSRDHIMVATVRLYCSPCYDCSQTSPCSIAPIPSALHNHLGAMIHDKPLFAQLQAQELQATRMSVGAPTTVIAPCLPSSR